MDLSISTATLVGFCLALVRTTAWVAVCPPFNSPAVPRRVRVALATAISFAIAGQVGQVAPSLEAGPFVLTLLGEILAGLALGFAVLIMFSAVQAAGDLIDLQVGFSLGAVLDPLSGSTAAPIGRLHQLMAITLMFTINGHVLVTRGFLRSVEALPMGTLDVTTIADELVGLLSAFLVAAVEIAIPVLAALFCTEIALGLLGKAAPQLNILVLGFAAKTLVAVILVGMTIALLPASTESLVVQAVRGGARALGG